MAGPGALSLKGFRGGASGGASGEDAAAEEGAFQGVVAMDTATAESGGFADRIEAGDGLAVVSEGARRQVGLGGGCACRPPRTRPRGAVARR